MCPASDRRPNEFDTNPVTTSTTANDKFRAKKYIMRLVSLSWKAKRKKEERSYASTGMLSFVMR